MHISHAGALVGVVACLAGCGPQGSGAATSASAEHALLGAQAPDFTLPAQSGGETASLSTAKGKVAIVDFWATWCEPCEESFPHYEALNKEFGDDLVILAESEDEEPDPIAAFAKKTGVTFPLAWDGDKTVAGLYDPPGMPTSYFLDRNGIVRHVEVSFKAGSEEAIRAKVQELIAQ